MNLTQQIAARMLAGRKPAATVKAPLPPAKVPPKSPEPAQAARRLISKPAPVVAKSPPRLATPPTQPDQQPPRVVSTPARHTRPAAYNPPPRPELDLVQALQALPLPPPAAEVPPPVIAGKWVGSCKAICADTGFRCRLPAHPGQAHAHERGPFYRIAAPNQTNFIRRDHLDRAATQSNPEAS